MNYKRTGSRRWLGTRGRGVLQPSLLRTAGLGMRLGFAQLSTPLPLTTSLINLMLQQGVGLPISSIDIMSCGVSAFHLVLFHNHILEGVAF